MQKNARILKMLASLGFLVLTFNLLLAACGDANTAVSGNTQAARTGGGILADLYGTASASQTTAAATTKSTTAANTTQVEKTTAATQTAIPSVQKYSYNFGSYKAVPSNVTPAFPAYTVKADLSNVTNISDFKLSADEKKLLAQNYFVVEPANFKQFFQAYESFRYDQIPTYISTDSLTHVFHLLFDKILRETEKQFLTGDLISLSVALYEATLDQYNSLKGTSLEPAVLRNLAFTEVALKLADPSTSISEDVPAAAKLAKSELALIEGASGFALSPIMGNEYREDYSQYIPRGHYTKTEELKNYFKAMMWYGRLTFRLKYDDETQSALLLTQAIQNGKVENQKASDLWMLIYEPTSFFVGNSDDLTYLDYANVAKAIWGASALSDPKVFSDKTKLAGFKSGVDKLASPKINSMYTLINEDRDEQIKGLRVMGQRFTIDAYIFQNLIWREVGTLEKPRELPKGLDIFAALGSDQALKLLQQQGETQYTNYSTQMTKMKTQVSNIGTDTWTQNLYWGWIYNLIPLTEKRDTGYPAYMQNTAWTNKQLVTGLGSWTELKHDTLLYAKQVYAERGGGPEELPTGFVEPEPEFYGRLAALTAMMRSGLQKRNLIDQSFVEILTNLEKAATTLKSIAEKELTGGKLTEDDQTFMAYWGASLESYTMQAADSDGSYGKNLDNQDAALVADVATGSKDVLEEGTGHVNLIYVAVPIEGSLKLAKGAVYSQYEFTVNPSDRMTDETWQKQLNDGKAPALEDWKTSYMANGATKTP